MDYESLVGGVVELIRKAITQFPQVIMNALKKDLQKYILKYTFYTCGVGALAADYIKKVKDFGPLIVAMDCYGGSIYKDSTRFDYMR